MVEPPQTKTASVELTDDRLAERIEQIRREFQQVDYSHPGVHLNRGIELLDALVGDLTDQRTQLLAERRRVEEILTEVEQGTSANNSRDYGRGVAFLARRVREVLPARSNADTPTSEE